MSRRKNQRVKRAPTGCVYAATRSLKRDADKLAGALKRDGFRTRVVRSYGGARLAYTVFSCGWRKR